MKKIMIMAAALALPVLAWSQKAESDSLGGFRFKDIRTVKTTPVKDQNKSGTCWAFSGTGLMEDEILRTTGKEMDLSEMYTVRRCYTDKARKYISMDGKINFAQGGGLPDILYVMRNYGLMPESAYSGLEYGEAKHSHYELADGLQGFLNGVMRQKTYTTAWPKAYEGILDAYFGKLPETFVYEGKSYTPGQFLAMTGLNPDNYICVTSYTHHPFYTSFPLEIADNWLWAPYTNVPMNEMQAIVDNALENGYSVAWAADVSEKGFNWKKGYAVLPAEVDVQSLQGTELSRWVTLSDADRAAERYKINGPCKEMTPTQESRQKSFENHETTDDHGMVIVGIAEDQNGNRYYKVKNSWDTNQVYGGYFYVSVPYFLEKTVGIMVNKDAVPKDIARKIK